ncbi:MAG: hypothetical protein R3245_03735 [Kiloniellales bacterium]|nr:hypothetical protein [Kiloniellales bacterium]
MAATRIAILSTSKLPDFLGQDHPDKEALFAEDDCLIAALANRGLSAERIAWQRKDIDWAAYGMAVIRSTWDYFENLPDFFETLTAIAARGCRLVNPLTTVRWNAEKRYLAELAEAGIPTAPSLFLDAGEDPKPRLSELGPAPGGYVRKPLVGVGAFGIERFSDQRTLLRAPPSPSPSLLQPFIDTVASEGEWSFVFGAGRFLYAALKRPSNGEFRVQGVHGGTTLPITPRAQDLEVAAQCYQALPVRAELARLDMMRLKDGRFVLMEAELIEPQLYLFDVPQAAAALAGAIHDLSMTSR